MPTSSSRRSGAREIVKGDWLKPGATVIDVGINRTGKKARRAGRRRRFRQRGASGGGGDHAGAGRCRADDDRGAAAQHPGGGASPRRACCSTRAGCDRCSRSRRPRRRRPAVEAERGLPSRGAGRRARTRPPRGSTPTTRSCSGRSRRRRSRPPPGKPAHRRASGGPPSYALGRRHSGDNTGPGSGPRPAAISPPSGCKQTDGGWKWRSTMATRWTRARARPRELGARRAHRPTDRRPASVPAPRQRARRQVAHWRGGTADGARELRGLALGRQGDPSPVDRDEGRRPANDRALRLAFVTFFVVIDPPGCAPIFAGLTAGAERGASPGDGGARGARRRDHPVRLRACSARRCSARSASASMPSTSPAASCCS